MARASRLVSVAMLAALGGLLGGCAGGLGSFDPSDMLDFLDTKKKLPGDRKPVFPGGVPGLEPGVPKDLYRGARAEPDAPPPQAAVPATEERPKNSRRASRTAPKDSPGAVQIAPADANVSPDEGEPVATPAPPASARPTVSRRRTTAPPPDPEPAPARRPQAAAPAQQSPQASPQASSPFPAPLPSGTFSR